MNRAIFFFCIFFVFINSPNIALHAQNANAYLVPHEIYVGDPAALIVPLPAAERDSPNIVITSKSFDPFFPVDPDIDFHRITLERRITGSKLTIEFTAFVPGVIVFPVIEIGGEQFSNLRITVNSTVDTSTTPVLRRAAPALSMPGTAVLLYGSLAAIIFLIFFIIWFIFKGRDVFKELRKKWKRRRLFTMIKKTEKRLRKSITKGAQKRIVLDILSDEFKNFLSILTNSNCRAMTAREFEIKPLDNLLPQEDSPVFLSNFFSSCDNMRFSGANIDPKDVISLLDDLKYFINSLENARKNKQKEEKAA